MAAKFEGGCFIHIPKTGGSWTRKVLQQIGEVSRDRQTHQLPAQWAYPKYFTVVREPMTWLRSAFVNNKRARFKEFPYECPWADFVRVIIPYRTNDFEEFVDNVTTHLPGVVGWLFGCYTPPKVVPIRWGKDLNEYLTDLGCQPELQAPVNVTGEQIEITQEMRGKIFKSEWKTYRIYGWDVRGNALGYGTAPIAQPFDFETRPGWIKGE
jgi:hypothetical protein